MQVYYGTFRRFGGKGIYHCDVDPAAGKQDILSVMEAPDAAYLTRAPDGKRLYAVWELSEYEGQPGGMVAAYEILTDGSLKFINCQSTGGGSPCHLSLSPDGRWLFAANYSGGNAAVYPLSADGAIMERQTLLTHTGSSVDPRRQTKPYCHFAHLTPDGTNLCVADLGTDSIVCYPFDTEKGVEPAESMRWKVKPGAGPRHIVFSPDGGHAYVVCEMGNIIEVYSYQGNGEAAHVQTISTLPEDFSGTSSCAAIRMSRDGGMIYASNRGHDSVAAFAVGEDGTLSLLNIMKTGGNNPRDIQITPDGQYILCGNQDEGGVTVLRVGPDGALSATGTSFADIPGPVSVLF